MTPEAPPLLSSVFFNLTNHILERGQGAVTDPRLGEQETILTSLLDHCTSS